MTNYEILLIQLLTACIVGCARSPKIAVLSATRPSPLRAELSSSDEHGYLTIEIRNVGDHPIALLDVEEGSGISDQFWTVEIKLSSGRCLKPTMWYALGSDPFEVIIAPGAVYRRTIQPVAYVEAYTPGPDEIGTITVRYTVADFERLKEHSMPGVRFSAEPLNVRLADYIDR